MSSGYSFDAESVKRISRGIRRIEGMPDQVQGFGSAPVSGPGGAQVRTPATLPVNYDGTQPLFGKLIDRDRDGNLVELADAYILGANDSPLQSNREYLGRMERVYNGPDGSAVLYRVQASGASAGESVKFTSVVPWRIMKVYVSDMENFYFYGIICVNSYRYFWTATTTDPNPELGRSVNIPDLTKLRLPGDPFLSDDSFWGVPGEGTDLSLYLVSLPSGAIENWYPFPDWLTVGFSLNPYVNESAIDYFASCWYNAIDSNRGFNGAGRVSFSGRFGKSNRFYVQGYNNERHYVYTNFYGGGTELGILDNRGLLTKHDVYSAIIKVRYQVYNAWPNFTAVGQHINGYRYKSQGSIFRSFTFFYEDWFNLLEPDASKIQTVLVQPCDVGRALPRWVITQVFHPRSPARLASATSGTTGTLAFGSSFGSASTEPGFQAPLLPPQPVEIPGVSLPGQSGGSSPGGGFNTKTYGEE